MQWTLLWNVKRSCLHVQSAVVGCFIVFRVELKLVQNRIFNQIKNNKLIMAELYLNQNENKIIAFPRPKHWCECEIIFKMLYEHFNMLIMSGIKEKEIGMCQNGVHVCASMCVCVWIRKRSCFDIRLLTWQLRIFVFQIGIFTIHDTYAKSRSLLEKNIQWTSNENRV